MPWNSKFVTFQNRLRQDHRTIKNSKNVSWFRLVVAVMSIASMVDMAHTTPVPDAPDILDFADPANRIRASLESPQDIDGR
jgi:hypothetical protein